MARVSHVISEDKRQLRSPTPEARSLNLQTAASSSTYCLHDLDQDFPEHLLFPPKHITRVGGRGYQLGLYVWCLSFIYPWRTTFPSQPQTREPQAHGRVPTSPSLKNGQWSPRGKITVSSFSFSWCVKPTMPTTESYSAWC